MSQNRIHIMILVGPPGSGKSTFAESYEREQKALGVDARGVMRFSADDFFVKDGVYRFDPEKLGEAHASCVRGIASMLNSAQRLAFPYTLIVDNTNTTALEMAPYYMLGQAYGATVEIVHFDTHPIVCARRNVHGVSEGSVRMSHERARTINVPPYWNVTQRVIRDEASYNISMEDQS